MLSTKQCKYKTEQAFPEENVTAVHTDHFWMIIMNWLNYRHENPSLALMNTSI